MDIWKYYDITHKKHKICNPMSKAKLDGLCSLLDLKPGSKVLDMGCGKGELPIRLVELFNISGIGVDISPYFIKDCKEKKTRRVPDSDIKFLEMDGSKYKPGENKLFDLTICLGTSFIYSGFIGTINALKDFMFCPYEMKEEERLEAIAVFMGEVPENYFEDGTWNINDDSVPRQVYDLMRFFITLPEFQLK